MYRCVIFSLARYKNVTALEPRYGDILVNTALERRAVTDRYLGSHLCPEFGNARKIGNTRLYDNSTRLYDNFESVDAGSQK